VKSSSSWEADNPSTGNKFCAFYGTRKIHYCVHKYPPSVQVRSPVTRSLNGKVMRYQYEDYIKQGYVNPCHRTSTCIISIFWRFPSFQHQDVPAAHLVQWALCSLSAVKAAWPDAGLSLSGWCWGLRLLSAPQQGLSVLCAKLFPFYVLQAVKSFNLKSNIPNMYMHLCFNWERCLLFLLNPFMCWAKCHYKERFWNGE
jgi:hypothetical protein